MTGGSLPSGVTLKVPTKGTKATVTISGRPKARGTYSVTLTATDSTGAKLSRTFTLTVA